MKWRKEMFIKTKKFIYDKIDLELLPFLFSQFTFA